MHVDKGYYTLKFNGMTYTYAYVYVLNVLYDLVFV